MIRDVKFTEAKKMKLVFVYGPPGVGKHTVGVELAKITGYKFFHNHYVVDLLVALFKWGSKPYKRVGSVIWKAALTEAAKNNINLIVTYVYAPIKEDKTFLRNLITIVKKHNGSIKFVRLTCKTAALHSRVTMSKRKKFKKLTDVKQLRKLMTDYDLNANILRSNTLIIDNTKLTARQCARKIKHHYRL
jgi:tRNA uridine 5-carbamoylmethylation protein Kti12